MVTPPFFADKTCKSPRPCQKNPRLLEIPTVMAWPISFAGTGSRGSEANKLPLTGEPNNAAHLAYLEHSQHVATSSLLEMVANSPVAAFQSILVTNRSPLQPSMFKTKRWPVFRWRQRASQCASSAPKVTHRSWSIGKRLPLWFP